MGDTEGVDDEESDGETHRDEHYPEARADDDEFPEAEVVFFFDGVEEGDGCEDPPGIAV